MNPFAASDASFTFCLVCTLLIPFAIIGISLLNTGLGRSRSAAHCMLSCLHAFAVAAIVYLLIGFAWQGPASTDAPSVIIHGRSWSLLGHGPILLRGISMDSAPLLLQVIFQIFCACFAAVIPVGSGADRWRLGSISISTALLAAIVFPLFAHWAWSGGWLAALGTNYALGRGFVDGGAGSIQVLGGLTALSITWLLGPRRGKFNSEGLPAAIPGHNSVLVLFGCLLSLVGWIGLNCASAFLLSGAPFTRAPLVVINTVIAAAASCVASVAMTRIRFGKPDASLIANGWTGGLVAISAGAAFVVPAAAILIGLVAGALVTLAVENFEVRLAVDDPGGAVSVHAVAGLWGLLAVGFLGKFSGSSAGQLLSQIVGISTLLGFVLPLTYVMNWLLDRALPQRVSIEGERQGMDIHELGADAYPEFVIHREEFLPR